jgi:lipooligosaccharide transport system permease protein
MSAINNTDAPTGAGTWIGAVNLVDIGRAKRWGAWYVAEYRLRNMSKWWQAIIAFGIGNPVLYLISVGLGIGALIKQSPDGSVSYLEFLAPALLATACIQAAMDETSFPVLEGFTWTRFLYAMNATSLRGSQITGGIMIASFIRCVATALMYGGILVAFGAINPAHLPALIVASIFAGMGFAAVMMAMSSYVRDDDNFFAIVGRFVIAPMFMFSGTFYPIEKTPIYLQWVGWISPLWHSTNMGRNLSYNHPVEPWLMAIHFAYLTALYFIGFYFASKQFAKRLAE